MADEVVARIDIGCRAGEQACIDTTARCLPTDTGSAGHAAEIDVVVAFTQANFDPVSTPFELSTTSPE
jgi:hypothetical protein